MNNRSQVVQKENGVSIKGFWKVPFAGVTDAMSHAGVTSEITTSLLLLAMIASGARRRLIGF